jgi:drug/metabolite transporter (DMT)-like permease
MDGVAFIVFALSGGVERWLLIGLFWFALVGLFGPFAARFLQYLATPHIGISRNHILLQTTPVWSTAIAIPAPAFGTLAIMAGSIFLVRERETGARGFSL